MKYLKLFEDINTYEWKEVSAWDVHRIIEQATLPFCEKDKERLSKLQFKFKKDTNYYFVNGIDTHYDYAVRKDNYYNLYIYKSDDEWYYLSVHSRSSTNKDYKCDRLDGLMTCMKDIGLLKIITA